MLDINAFTSTWVLLADAYRLPELSRARLDLDYGALQDLETGDFIRACAAYRESGPAFMPAPAQIRALVYGRLEDRQQRALVIAASTIPTLEATRVVDDRIVTETVERCSPHPDRPSPSLKAPKEQFDEYWRTAPRGTEQVSHRVIRLRRRLFEFSDPLITATVRSLGGLDYVRGRLACRESDPESYSILRTMFLKAYAACARLGITRDQAAPLEMKGSVHERFLFAQNGTWDAEPELVTLPCPGLAARAVRWLDPGVPHVRLLPPGRAPQQQEEEGARPEDALGA